MDAQERDAWRQADTLFNELVELPPAQRQTRLAELEPGSMLRSFVERLLAADNVEGGLLEHPIPIALLPQAQGALTGRRLGRWRLLEEIGRGGMSVVYRAVADEGATGQVAAVKVLTLGALAEQGRERFLQEQQALLRLRHPYLATLYDAGVADDGTPWLAMALVEGQRIDAWCQARHLSLEARVRLLQQVCGALAYAHRNLVIHRDIKPSNVLVDDDGHVRVLDFGIARLADATASERTATSLRALTPEYASPEQFSGAPASTLMDVFGVGALAYRLLTGMPPRLPTNVDGPPIALPSRAVRTAGHLVPSERTARARRLRGDLDTVVMKALSSVPEERYASIEKLAEDLGRWLDQRPVRAHPPSRRYRLWKFVFRNRVVVASSLLVSWVVAAGIASTLWHARLAQSESARARDAAEQSQAQLDYLDSVLEVLTPTTESARGQDQHQLIAEVAQRARRELSARPPLLASIELRLGWVAQRAGDYPQSLDLFEAALRRRRAYFPSDSAEVAMALVATGVARRMVSPPQSELAARELDAAAGVLRSKRPGSGELVTALTAMSMHHADDEARSGALLAEATTICAGALANSYNCEDAWLAQGRLLARHERYTEAIIPLDRVWQRRRVSLGAEHAGTLMVASQLGKVYGRSGDRSRGIALLQQTHAIQQRIYATPTVDTLDTINALASLLTDAGDYAGALVLRERQLRQARRVFGDTHANVALVYGNMGNVFIGEGRFGEAADAYLKSLDLYRQLDGAESASVVVATGNYADALREGGNPQDALPLHQWALAGSRRVFGENTLRAASRASQLARTEVKLGQVQSAVEHYDLALGIYRALEAVDDPSAAMVRAHRSQALLLLGRGEEAVAEARAALEEVSMKVGESHRFYWEALGMHLRAACAAGNSDCAPLRLRAEGALRDPLVATGIRVKLRTALLEPGPVAQR